MRPLDFPILADENIDPEVVSALRSEGKDITAAVTVGLGGASDTQVMRCAHSAGRVVLTHDRDFGRLAIQRGEPYVGLVYLRPGHVSPSFALETLAAIQRLAVDVSPPFILVAERREDRVRIRIRGTSVANATEKAPD